MKIPKRLKIGGHIFEVDDSKELSENTDADSDTKNLLIRIDKNLPQTQKESELIHEIFHMINVTLDDSEIGHALLDSLSEQFYQVLKDNNLLK